MNRNALALAVLTLSAGAVHAEDYLSPTEERVRLTLGFYRVSTSTNIRADSSAGLAGTPVSAEKDFGLQKSNVEAKFQAMIRVGERHRLRFDYFSLDRTGNRVLDQPYVFKDVVLQPNDPLEASLSMRVLGITYGYSFIHRERFELAATLGVNITDLSARARVTTPLRHVDQSIDQAGPLPLPGLDATWVISKRFYLDGKAQYVRAHVSHFDGSLGVYELDALYRLREYVAFGVGYSLIKAELTSTATKNAGFFDFNTKGPTAFVRIAF